ncbi:MAG: HipA N-terminal domain-containing protein [Sphaerochaeta sp.]
MRKAKVFVNDDFAGSLVENNDGLYVFTYEKGYSKDAVSLTLPIREKPYKSEQFFSFFDGLIPEGWLLEIVKNNWKIKETDRMGLLLACCKDCIGNVRIEKDE